MMKHLSDMTESEKYQLAYKHYLESRANSNTHKGEAISLFFYKQMLSVAQVEEILTIHGYAQ